jgi:hypothetical protein
MYVVPISLQGPARTNAPSDQATVERADGGAARQNALSQDELREQIRASIQAATEAARQAREDAREAQNQARDADHQVRIVNGVPMPPRPGDPQIAGTTVDVHGFPSNDVIPDGVVEMALGFFTMCAVMVVGWPLARAFGRRIERNAQPAGVAIGMADQLQRIEQAVDAMSVEIERISESQRFLTKLQSGSQANHAEHAALPSDRR